MAIDEIAVESVGNEILGKRGKDKLRGYMLRGNADHILIFLEGCIEQSYSHAKITAGHRDSLLRRLEIALGLATAPHLRIVHTEPKK